MTLEEAKEILKDEVKEDGLYNLGWYLGYVNGNATATLDGEFDADSLEAISVYIRHYQT